MGTLVGAFQSGSQARILVDFCGEFMLNFKLKFLKSH